MQLHKAEYFLKSIPTPNASVKWSCLGLVHLDGVLELELVADVASQGYSNSLSRKHTRNSKFSISVVSTPGSGTWSSDIEGPRPIVSTLGTSSVVS